MPMTVNGLSGVLEPVIKSQISGSFMITPAGQAELDKFAKSLADALAQAIVPYIQTNALVTGTVTSGQGSGGNVTGTVS